MTSALWLLIGAAFAGPQAGESTLIVALGADAVAADRVEARTASEAKNDTTIVSHAEAALRLTGTREASKTPVEELREMLARARELDADFESGRAVELFGQIIMAYRQSLRPSPEQRAITAEALQDFAASLHANGDTAQAEQRAIEAVRRFPDHPPNPKRFSTKVLELFDDANETVQAGPHGKLVVISPQNGEVLVDGRSLGNSRGRVMRTLPVGRYRVWLVTEARISLPRPVEITASSEVTVGLDAGLDHCLELAPVIALTCEKTWERDLVALLRAVGAENGIGVPPEDYAGAGASVFTEGTLILAADAVPSTVTMPASADRPEHPDDVGCGGPPEPADTIPAFSPAYLVPLGVGQFFQERYVFGAAYLAADIGLVVWTIVASLDYSDVVRSGSVEAEPDARLRRNLALGLTISFAVATVIEAVIVGLVIGE